MSCVLTVRANGKTEKIVAEIGASLLSVMQSGGHKLIDAPCGGNGKCGKCLVRAAGALSEPEEAELRLLGAKKGYRLACLTRLLGDAEVETDEQDSVVETEGAAFGFAPDMAGEGEYGVAVDIGTTTVAAYFYELKSGRLMEIESGLNDQRGFGADVISRAAYDMENRDGLRLMQEAVCGQIDGYIEKFCGKHRAERDAIRRVCVAGNTIMQHIFYGLETRTIAVAPFAPLDYFGGFRDISKTSIKLKNASLYMPPAAAGYVGGDITAGMLAGDVYKDARSYIFLDIGTNGEMVLHSGGRYICAATAAGPAFEGAEIECGVGGIEGAINEVELKNGLLSYGVIGDKRPFGICGSGLIDAVSVMLELEAIDETGRMLDEDEAGAGALKYLEDDRFYIDSDKTVYVSASDIRKVQLAKAAVAAGIDVLLNEAGIKPEQVGILYLAGGFGSNLNPVTAADIGLFPKELSSRVKVLGNAAGSGASAAMLSEKARNELSKLKDRLEYIELSSDKRFTDAFIEQMCF